MNKNFFDNNKLYLKSVVDYKTRYHKKANPVFANSPTNGDGSTFPQIVGGKKATDLIKSRESVKSGSDGADGLS